MDNGMRSEILSFETPSAQEAELRTPGDAVPGEPERDIWATLRHEIEKLVKKDGIRKDAIQPGQIEEDVFSDAVDNIYHDVAEFYDWYFNKDDDRTAFIFGSHGRAPQKQAVILGPIQKAVNAVVLDNLDAMREVDEIPQGQDTDALDEILRDSLSRYIANWEDWYYDRKREQEIDNYFEQKSVHEEIYVDSDYGDLSNLIDNGQYDGLTDVPYSSEA